MRSPHCAALQAVIHSKHAFSYQEAQARIDNAQDESPITAGLRQLNALAKALRRCGAAPCHICTGTARTLQDCAVPTPHPARPPAASLRRCALWRPHTLLERLWLQKARLERRAHARFAGGARAQ